MTTPTHQRSSSDTFRALSRHEVYYLTGGDLFFLAEHIHFRIHRYFFERESPFFQRQLQVPVSPGAVARGSTEGTAIILEERPDDFAKFLWVFYNPRYSLYNTSVADWKTILQLAHKWEFAEVKKLVVRELEKLEMSDVDRIATYQKHDVDKNFLIPRYAALCEREQPLTLVEGMQLGMETTLMIARAREYARSNPSSDGLRSPTSADIKEDEMHSLIRLLFDIQPSTQVNGDDHANGTVNGTGTGSGTPAGGLVPPPPPEKPTVVIPPATPTAGKSTATKGKQATPQGKGEAAKGVKEKAKEKRKLPPLPPSPLATTTTTPMDPEPPLQDKGNPEKEGKDAESLIDLGGPSSTTNNGSQTKDVDVGDAAADDVKSDEPVQNGEAGKTGESGKPETPEKPDETVKTGETDEAKKAGEGDD